jgi:hypothetical protein
LAVVDGIYGVAVVFQNAGQRLGQANVVFNYQDMHRSAPSRLAFCVKGIVPRCLKAT